MQHAVVEGVTQLMRQRADVGGAARKVGHHAADVLGVIAGTECAAALALAREHIDPALVERGTHHLAHFRAEFAEQVEQQRTRFFDGIGAGALTDGREQIVERQTVFMTEQASLRLEILAHFRQSFANRRPHGFKRLFIHAGMGERHIQHALVTLERRHRFALRLDVVQAEAHRQFNLLVGSQLGFVGAAARIGIAVVSQRTHGRQRNLLAVVIDQQGRIQLIAQLGEGFAAGELHLQDRLFQRFRKLMLGILRCLAQGESTRLQFVVGVDDRVEVVKRSQIAGEGVGCQRRAHDSTHQRCHRGVGSFVVRVHGERQPNHQAQTLEKVGQRFLLMNQRNELLNLVLSGRGDSGGEGVDLLRQTSEVILELRVVKVLVEYGQIPIRFHRIPPYAAQFICCLRIR